MINEDVLEAQVRFLENELAKAKETLRDQFAMHAMQAMLSSPNCPMQVDENELADQAYVVADAMMEARKK